MQYLLFHLFNGAVDDAGVFEQIVSAQQLLSLVQQISTMFRPVVQVASRQLGFDWGPITPDMGAQQAVTSIEQAFAVALATDTAVAIHLDDRMLLEDCGIAGRVPPAREARYNGVGGLERQPRSATVALLGTEHQPCTSDLL